jgi:hypothetical protein
LINFEVELVVNGGIDGILHLTGLYNLLRAAILFFTVRGTLQLG